MLLKILETLAENKIVMSSFRTDYCGLTVVLSKGEMKMTYAFSPMAQNDDRACAFEMNSTLLSFVAEYEAITGEGDDRQDQEG